MSKQTKDFYTFFSYYECEDDSKWYRERYPLNTALNSGNYCHAIIDENEMDINDFVHKVVPDRSKKNTFDHYFGLKNRVFPGPFQIVGTSKNSSSVYFTVKLATVDNIDLRAAVSVYTMLELIQNGDIEGSYIKCDMTFSRAKGTHQLVRVTNEEE